MRRINIVIGEDLDDRLEEQARRLGTSKSSIVRETLDDALPAREDDPIEAMIGISDAEPVDDIYEYLYGWPT